MKKLITYFLLSLFSYMVTHAQNNFIKSTVNATLGFQLRSFATADKGWIVFTMDSLKLAKFNSCGQNEWNKKYNIPNAAIGLSNFIQSNTGDFLLLTRLALTNNAVSLLTRINQQGNILWSKSYQDTLYNHFPYTISEDQQGNIYLYANVEHTLNNNYFNLIIKLDSNGNMNWSKLYDQGGIWGGATATTDNGLLIRTGSNFIKIDSAGNVLWHSAIFINSYNYFAPIEVSDGFIYTGSNNTNQLITFSKIDKLGNLLWTTRKTSNLTGNIPLFCKAKNGNFCAVFANTVIEFDKDLNVVKQNAIGLSGANLTGKVLCFTADNFPVLVGIAGNEIFTAKLDANYKNYCDATSQIFSVVDDPITQAFFNTSILTYNFNTVNHNYVIDTFSLTMNNLCFEPKYLNLGKDTAYCGNSTILLQNQNVDTFDTYQWSTGETTATININQSGSYSLHCTYNCGENFVDDTIAITIIPAIVNNLGADLFLCKDSTTELTGAQCANCTYTWSTGSTLSTIEINEEGTYWLSINNGNGCISADTLEAYTVKCNCNVYLPNSFTPNNDGLNDVFKPVYDCDFNSYSLKIFNRWGALLFETTTAFSFWDGIENSVKVQEGVYIYLLNYQPILKGKVQNTFSKSGTVAVIY